MKRGLMLILVLFGMGLTALAQTAFDTRYNKAYEYYKKGEYRNALIQLDAASKGPRTQEQQIKADKLINQCNNAIAAANTLKVTPAELTIPFSGGRDSVVVKAGSKWKVGSMPKWLSHVQLGTTLVFSVSPNAERAERSGYVEIVMGRYKEYVKVVQEARPEAVRKVHVRTKPEKAKIVVDNEQSALTNYSFDLREGHHSIVITKNGYEPVATSVTIPDEITDEPINLEIPLVPMFGTISLNVKTGTGEGFTETPVAEIGNKPVDLYPVKLYSFDEEADIRYYELYEGNIIPLYPAEYQVKVKAEGYREQTCPIIVSRGSHEDLEFVLNNRVGSFSVDNFGLAEGARILLDGKDVGEVPAKQIPARVGRHKLHFVKEGYITPQESYIVDISEGRDVIVTVSMDRYAAYRFVTKAQIDAETTETVKYIVVVCDKTDH